MRRLLMVLLLVGCGGSDEEDAAGVLRFEWQYLRSTDCVAAGWPWVGAFWNSADGELLGSDSKPCVEEAIESPLLPTGLIYTGEVCTDDEGGFNTRCEDWAVELEAPETVVSVTFDL